MYSINQKYPTVDYGPLTVLIGTWVGDKGMDISPEPDGTEENPYYETIVYEEAGDLSNAEEQTISIVRYLQIVKRKSNDEVFHDQTGYWMWDAQNKIIMQSLVIPRAVSLLAGGESSVSEASSEVTFKVKSDHEKKDWGIVQSPFMLEKALTKSYEVTLKVSGDEMTYSELTKLEIYGRAFDHTDDNVLTRVK